ncbi:hypothetical protein ACMHYB_57000 [Sorangium sp. So ce1128]
MRSIPCVSVLLSMLLTAACDSGGGEAGGGGHGGAGGSGGLGSGGRMDGAGGSGGATSTGSAGGECVTAGDCPPAAGSCDGAACVDGACVVRPDPERDGAPCDDGDACTEGEVCAGGACGKGNPRDCSALDSECAVGRCDPAAGCALDPINEDAACDLGNTCGANVCRAGQCVVESVFAPDGTPCDDSRFCTVGDVCSGGACVSAPNRCGAPDDGCTVSSCDEAARTCVVTPANEGRACDDGDGCTAGTACQDGICGTPTSTIAACTTGDSCCPSGCSDADDGDCPFWRSGVQEGVPASSLSGWTQCFSNQFAESGPALSEILARCSKRKLLLACRPVGAESFTLLAMAPRADVLWPCGDAESCVHEQNGVGWYFDERSSWGFAPAGEPVMRLLCDDADGEPVPHQRMCWHTVDGSLDVGYRCGDNDLNYSPPDWERVIYHAD